MSFSARRSVKNEKTTSAHSNESHDGMNKSNTSISRNSSMGNSRSSRKNGSVRSQKRQSQVFIAAQSLDLELQNVNHLKRMSIGSIDDTHVDPEMYYTVATHPSANRTSGNDYQQLEYLNMNMNLKTPRNSMISETPVSYSDLYSFSETETESDAEDDDYTHSESENDRNFSYESDADSIQQTINSYESNDEEGVAEREGEDEDEENEEDHHNMSYNKTGHEYLGKHTEDLDSTSVFSSGKPLENNSSSLLQKRRSIHSKRTLSNRSSLSNRIASQGSSIKSSENNSLFSNETKNNNDIDEENSIQSLLWVPANKHPSVKPENYLEFVQDKLHHLKIDTQNLNKIEENKIINGTGNYQNYASSKNSTISRKPSKLRKSYTEFDTQVDGNGNENENENTANESSTENLISSDQIYSPNTTRKISLQQITDELTKLSKKAGIIGTDAASLARSLSMSTTNLETNSTDDEEYMQENKKNTNRKPSTNSQSRSGSLRRNKSVHGTTYDNGTKVPCRTLSDSRTNSIKRNAWKKTSGTPARQVSLGRKSLDFKTDEDGFASNIMNEQPGTNSSSPSSSLSSASSNKSLQTGPFTKNQSAQFDKNSDQIIKGPQRSVLQRSKFTTYRQKSLNKRIASTSSVSSSASSSPTGNTWTVGNSATSPLTQTQFQPVDTDVEYDFSKSNDEVSTENDYSFESTRSATEDESWMSHAEDDEEEEEEKEEEDEDEDDDLSSMVTADDGSSSQDTSFNSSDPAQGRSLSPNKDLLKNDYLQKVSHARNRHMIAGARERVLEQDKETSCANSVNDIEEAQKKEVADSGSEATRETQEEENPVKRKKTRFMSMIRRHIRPDTKNKLKFSKETQLKTENSSISASLSTPSSSSESSPKKVSLQTASTGSDSSQGQTSLQPAVSVVSIDMQNNAMKNASNPRKNRNVSVDVYGDMVLELEQENFLDDISTSDEGSARVSSQRESVGYANGKFDRDGVDQEVGLDESQSIRTSETSIQSDESSGSNDSVSNLEKYPHSSDAQKSGLDKHRSSSRDDAQYTWSSQNENASGTVGYATSDESENSIDPESPITLETSSHSSSIAAPTPLPPRKLRYEDVIRPEKPNSPMVYRDSSFGFPLPPLTISTVIMFDQRLPVSMERAIYRLSHMKLSDSKRELRQQVLLSNFMYSYLNLVNHSLYLQKLEEEMA